ncbi:formate dehydrogenase subunit delta [Novosphingobium sp. ERN07]|uniref:formate dehydrogenase subunit delta n=1 Tax=Novosphingobium sp. ERN07 TaxID=2726187 RepID=UPI001456ACC8|nr:formate dehydrogenase subunit delta [Novosphingobium sp. ERN07]NLR73263.1 formate dehydrogenase subunit delta [Novosphingobium sp. ERN07]
MSGHTADKLTYMANQIARNMGHDEAPVASVADHIVAFWTPRMIGMLLAEQGAGLDPIAADAMTRIAAGRIPPPQTRATDPAVHGSDAG